MENLGIKELRDILRIAEIANGTPDRALLGREVLAAVAGALGVEKCMFILQEEGAASPEFFYRGIERVDVDRYIAYFHSQDPLGLLSKVSDRFVVSLGVRQHATVSLRETVSHADFMMTEYYNEFYRPQGIFHEIATRLESSTQVRGVIDLLRSERDPAFSAREIQVMDCLAPHLSRALDTIELRREIQVKNDVLARFEARYPDGPLLCDERMRVFGLTGREAEIVNKIFDGKTNAQIGEALFISEFTVKKHLQNICEKLNVKSRTAILSTILGRQDEPAHLPGRHASR